MLFQNVFTGYVEAGLRLLYPSVCALCHRLLELEEKGLCLSCADEFQKLKLSPGEERIRTRLQWADEGWALFRYEGPVKEIFHQIKFERRRDLLHLFKEPLARIAAARPQWADYDRVIGIPLDSRRRLEREFNQSGLLADALAKSLGKKTSPLSFKKSPTPPQSLLNREARKWNLGQAFRVTRPREIEGKSILLVDDIFTTGATLDEAAKTLKKAGARRVGCAVAARAFAD